MNGTVAPSSSSATVAATCASRTPSSFAISRSMEVVTHAPVAMERLRGRADHSGPLPGVHMDVGSADSSTPKAAMPAMRQPAESNHLERDDFSSNRHPALAYCWSMIFSENRFPLFG